MTEHTDVLLSTGGLARRLGVSQSAVALWEREGLIPRGIVVEGSGRKVWRHSDLAYIQQCVESRRERREELRLSAA